MGDYPDHAVYFSISDASGESELDLKASGKYFMVVEYGDKSNVLAREYRNGISVGYVIRGLFQTQAEVDEAGPAYEGLGPGSLKILDVNADGIINADDKEEGYSLTIEGDMEVTVYIDDINSMQ
jgi:hypothetical protein